MKKKVLIIEDDPDLARVVKLVLTLNGYSSEYVCNVKNLDKKISSYSPNLILMDVFLGKSDGREVCKELKAKVESSHIPVVLFSGDTEILYEYKKWDAQAFIPKPFETEHFINIIEKSVI